MHISRIITAARGVAIALAAAAALALPADALAADEPAAPPVSSFHWNVQLSTGMAQGGISADLPSAIQLAKAGLTLSEQDAALIVTVLTEQAKTAGVSLVTATPAAPAPVASAIPAVTVDSDYPNDPGE